MFFISPLKLLHSCSRNINSVSENTRAAVYANGYATVLSCTIITSCDTMAQLVCRMKSPFETHPSLSESFETQIIKANR